MDEIYNEKTIKKYSEEELIGLLSSYPDKFKTRDFDKYLIHLQNTLNDNKEKYNEKAKYSFSNGVKVFRRKEISPQDAIKSIIEMLFARDYFNLNAIKTLRSYLQSSKTANEYLDFASLNENPGSTLLGLFFSDYKLIAEILIIYRYVSTNPGLLLEDINLNKDGILAKEDFDQICTFIYARYIVSVYLFIIECDYSGYFDGEVVDKILLKVYRTFSILILRAVYRNLSMFEFTLFSNLEILNDVCVYAHEVSSRYRLDEARAMASAISADVRYKNYEDVIKYMLKIALKKRNLDENFSHTRAIAYFRSSEGYGPYFEKRGFERQFRKAIIEAYRQKGYPVIGINASGYTRPHKKAGKVS